MAISVMPLDVMGGSPTFTAQQTRQAWSAFLGAAPGGRPLGAISGVRPGTPSTTVANSSFTWTVAAHSGCIDAETATAGPYVYATDGTDTGTITAADATNPRVDIIYVKINDDVMDGSGLRGGVVGYLAGTPAATPSPPATPARSIVLAQISVPASGSGSPATSWVAPVFGQRGGVWLNKSTIGNQSIPDSTWTTLTWGSGVVAQTGGLVFSGTAGQYTVPRDGWYNLSGAVEFASNSTGSRFFRFRVPSIAARFSAMPATGTVTSIQGSLDVYLPAGSNIYIEVYQSSGGALVVNGDSNFGTVFTVIER